ncbi:MAG: LysM peptidoglycan-binding domain-containing protein [Desulfobacteraceae bacterium]|nr:LysM peptidoglycan-binding domain-containing protein [Desulfobacteraceae bacterium]
MKRKKPKEISEYENKPRKFYFDEEKFSPWAYGEQRRRGFKFAKNSLLIILVAAMAIQTGLLIKLSIINKSEAAYQDLQDLKRYVAQLEKQLENYSGIDKEVARIRQQAQSSKKFEERFDRGEASISLRMDHLTMSLENLQKQFAKYQNFKPVSMQKPIRANEPDQASKPSSMTTVYHTVVRGDTLYGISKRYNLGLKKLLKMNEMATNAVIMAGQKLIIKNGS